MAIIYDIETLSQDQHRGVIVSLALLNFDMHRVKYGPDYTWEELLQRVDYVKFDVAQQVKEYGRKICPHTLLWWQGQGKDALDQLKPSSDDIDLKEMYSWFISNTLNANVAYTRNNTFDPVFIQFICSQFGDPMPYHWGATRDIKSTIDGMTWGQDIKDNFIPEGLEGVFIAHDPRHDVAMDIMRMQYLSRLLIDEIPF